MRRFALLPDEALEHAWTWRDRQTRVRYALYRSLEEEQEALVRARAEWEPTEAERILALAQRAFGDLRGLLVGIDEQLLDRAPAEGQWPLRLVLRHALTVEKRYAAQVVYSAHRREEEPVAIPPDRLPHEDDADVAGDIARILDRFATFRAQTDALCGALPAAAMARPALWGGFEVDVRFRLHRFASHIVEHTIQCEKTLDALGSAPSEARRIVRRISTTRGELEASGDAETLQRLDTAHAERAAAIGGPDRP